MEIHDLSSVRREMRNSRFLARPYVLFLVDRCIALFEEISSASDTCIPCVLARSFPEGKAATVRRGRSKLPCTFC